MSEQKSEGLPPNPVLLETLCREVCQHLKATRRPLGDAAYIAQKRGDHELDKSLTAVTQAIEGLQGLMITLPRLKG